MLRTFARTLVTAIALAAFAAMSAPAFADAPPATVAWTDYHYETAITSVYGSPYPIAGRLDIQITQQGVLRGYYHNAYQKSFIQVVGGRDGNYIWFDIGPPTTDIGIPGVEAGTGRVHVIASVSSDGSIHGQIFPNYGAGPGDGFSPEPQASVPEQFLFAGKPVEPGPDTTRPGGPPQ